VKNPIVGQDPFDLSFRSALKPVMYLEVYPRSFEVLVFNRWRIYEICFIRYYGISKKILQENETTMMPTIYPDL